MNPYAHELAQVVVGSGYIQLLRDNGFGAPSMPVLKPLDNVEEKTPWLARDSSASPSSHVARARLDRPQPAVLGGSECEQSW